MHFEFEQQYWRFLNGIGKQSYNDRCIHVKLKVSLFLQRIFWKIALQFSKVLLRNDHGILYTYQNMKRWGHKRVYHMHSDVIFGWVLWIWLSSWHFFLSIFIFFVIARKTKGGRSRFAAEAKTLNFVLRAITKKIKILRKKCQLLSQIHNTQPKTTSLYIW